MPQIRIKSGQIAEGAVTDSHLAGSIQTSKLADGDRLAFRDTDNAWSAPQTFRGSVTVIGDLTVIGDTNQAAVTEVNIGDTIMRVAAAATDSSRAAEAGIEVYRGGKVPNAQLLYSEAEGCWKAGVAGAMENLVRSSDLAAATTGPASGAHAAAVIDEVRQAASGYTSLSERLAAIQAAAASELSSHSGTSTNPHGTTLTQNTIKTSTITERISGQGVVVQGVSFTSGGITLGAGQSISGDPVHRHYRYLVKITTPSTRASLPDGVPDFVVGDGSLEVYVNGILQNAYTEVEKTAGSGLGRQVDFAPDVLEVGDEVTFRYYRYV